MRTPQHWQTRPDIIFSDLGPSADNRYSTRVFLPLSGKFALGDETETWAAVRFVPKVDVQASVLEAAIQYSNGTKLITLVLYSNDEASNSVGAPLPGGQGNTAQIPDDDGCCQVVKVTLQGEGVTLTGGTAYRLVAKAGDKDAPDFNGLWRISNIGNTAGGIPPPPWGNHAGNWPAAEIRGKNLRTLTPTKAVPRQLSGDAIAMAPSSKAIISNLDRTSTEPYFNVGMIIAGNSAVFPEEWQALPFTPQANVHAKELAAAIAALGQDPDQRINLGIYSDNGGVPGTLLPGGQGSTSDLPLTGECCDLAEVRLPGAGVALTGGVQYWLVASPDNTNDPYFEGIWRASTMATGAYKEPKHSSAWVNLSGGWLGAQIRGHQTLECVLRSETSFPEEPCARIASAIPAVQLQRI